MNVTICSHVFQLPVASRSFPLCGLYAPFCTPSQVLSLVLKSLLNKIQEASHLRIETDRYITKAWTEWMIGVTVIIKVEINVDRIQRKDNFVSAGKNGDSVVEHNTWSELWRMRNILLYREVEEEVSVYHIPEMMSQFCA